jgi:hypothetical protein
MWGCTCPLFTMISSAASIRLHSKCMLLLHNIVAAHNTDALEPAAVCLSAVSCSHCCSCPHASTVHTCSLPGNPRCQCWVQVQGLQVWMHKCGGRVSARAVLSQQSHKCTPTESLLTHACMGQACRALHFWGRALLHIICADC